MSSLSSVLLIFSHKLPTTTTRRDRSTGQHWKAGHSFCQPRIHFVKTRRVNYDLTLKVHVENLTLVKVKVMT